MNANRWRILLRVLQVAVTIGLMAWLISQVEWSTIHLLLTNARWSLVALSFVALLLSHLINVIRWRYLLDQPQLNYGTLLALYGAGLFSNNFLPTGIGGDAVRVALLNRRIPIGRAMFSVVLDRAIGLFALSALFMLGLLGGLPSNLDLRVSDRPKVLQEWHGLALVLLVSSVLVSVGLMGWRLLPVLRVRLMSAFSKRTAEWDVPRWSGRLWLQRLSASYMISVGSHLCIVAAIWAMLGAMRVDVPPFAAIWLVVISSLSLLLPIAVNGVGIVEGVYVVVLGSYGVGSSIGLSVALAVRMITLLVSLTGGVLILNRPVIEVKARG